MLDPKEILKTLSTEKYGPLTGVPCSLFGNLCKEAEKGEFSSYISATSEGEAMGIAAGIYAGGQIPVVLMQNSGLGNAINPLTSLHLMNNIPALLFVSLRGEVGIKDAPEHTIMGQITEDLLKLIGVEYEVLSEDINTFQQQLQKAKQIIETNKPFALIIKKGQIDKTPSEPDTDSPLMSRKKAIDLCLNHLNGNEAIVSTTGMISRETFDHNPEAKNVFYMIGSMGCASSMGLGVALQKPKQLIVVFDGDGALLLKMGTLATIGHYKPQNFLHIVFDNETYESTGGQATISSTVNFSEIAKNVGYPNAVKVETEEELIKSIDSLIKAPGPSMIHIKVQKGTEKTVGRVTFTPEEIKNNFKDFLKQNEPIN